MYNLGDAVGHIRLEIGNFLSDAERVRSSSANIDSQFNKLEKTCKTLETVIVTSFAAIGTAVVTGLGKAVDVGSQFERSMSQVAATMGMTAEDVSNGSADFEKLSAAAKEMGETTKFSASQAADALNYLALAGYNTEQAISTLPTVLNLAASGGMDLAKASDMITDAASALGLGLDDLSLFSDKMAKAAQSSNTSVQQLGDAILQIGGTARNLAGGVTELNTALGVLANNGIKAAEGGTALRQIILNLTAPTKQAKDYMNELGLEVKDLQGNVRPLNEIFKDLDEILQSKGITGSADKIEALSNIFDARQLKSATALLNGYGESWDRLYNKIDNAEGAAAQMAETMETNLKGALTILGSTAEGFGITIYESIQGSLKNAVEEATVQLSNLNKAFKTSEMQEALQKISDSFSGLIVKLSEFLSDVIPKLVEGLADLIENFDKISALAAGLATTIGLASGGMLLFKIQTDLVTQSLIAQKVAQLAANAAMLANPYTLVALGVGILVGALVNEYQQQQQNIEQLDRLNQKYYDTEDAVNTMAENYDKEIEKARELENSRDNEIDQVNELLSLIEKNVDESGNIISNTEMVKDAIDELNSIIPVNIQYQGNQITNYELLTQASKDYCEQLKNQAILEARQEEYKAAAVAYDTAIKERDAIRQNLQEASDNYQKYIEIKKAFDEGYFLQVEEVQKEAEAAGMKYSEYVEDMAVTTRKALDSATDAYAENERIIRESSETLKNAEIDIVNTQNEIYAEQLKTGQEVTGMYASESEARIGIAQIEADRIAEINRQSHQDQLSETQDYADDVIDAEEELEAALEQLEIDYNTGVIQSDEEYHKKRLELLNNFHGEWSKKTSSWLKSELNYEQQQREAQAKEEERRRQEAERERERQEREAERQKQEAERQEQEKNKSYFENLKYRKDTNVEYTNEMYKKDLEIFQNTLEEGTDLYRQVGREIVSVNNDIAEESAKALKKPFEDMKKDRSKNSGKDTWDWDNYISGLEEYAKILDKNSELYKEVMEEIADAEEKSAEDLAKRTEKINKEAFAEFKRRKRDELDYTNAAYIEDLTAFSETLDKKSDLYQDVLDEIDNANKSTFDDIKDNFEINERNGYTLEQYLEDLKNFLSTLTEGTEMYEEVAKEISRTQDKIDKQNENAVKEEQKRIDDNNKKYLNGLKNRLKEDETYTKDMYLNDLLLFAETLNKESDMYQTVLDEIASVKQEIKNENQKLADDSFKAWEKGFNNIKSEAEKAYDKIQNKQKSLEETLNKSVKLIETKTKQVLNTTTGLWEKQTVKTTSTNFFKKQIADLNDYQKQLERLEKRGVSKDLMAEIMGMSEEDAKEYVKQLNQMSDSSLKAYDEAYTSIKKKNKEFAESYYADEIEAFKTEWGDKIKAYIETLPDDAKNAAEELIENFISGLTDSDNDETNNAFYNIFENLTSGLSEKISNGDLFKNYGTKSVDSLNTEIKESSDELVETTEDIGENIGNTLGDTIINNMNKQENGIKKQVEKWGQIIKEGLLNPLKEIKKEYDSVLNTNIPNNIYNNKNNNTDNSKNNSIASTSTHNLTKEDIEKAIKNAIPDGDIIMKVDGDRLAKISRKQLNILAQKNGTLGLKV